MENCIDDLNDLLGGMMLLLLFYIFSNTFITDIFIQIDLCIKKKKVDLEFFISILEYKYLLSDDNYPLHLRHHFSVHSNVWQVYANTIYIYSYPVALHNS